MSNKVSRLPYYLGSLLLAFLFCLRFSITTSFLFNIQGEDSAMFYLMGKSWTEGYLPYVSLWDHKGPLIFFINSLGHLLTGTKLGVFIIQTVSLSFFVYFTFLTFRKRFSDLASAGLVVTSLFWLGCSYEGGNLTEEYLLPFLALSIYLTYNWLEQCKDGNKEHNPWNAFLLGFILGFSFLTRLTNALGSCGMMLGIGLILLVNQRWKNLLWNVVAYVAGFLVITAPFVIYFQAHGALHEMMFGTILYNLTNVEFTANKTIANGPGATNFIKFCILAINSLGLILVSLYSFIFVKEKRESALVWFLASLFLSLWFLKSNMSAHYRTLAVPFFTVLIIELWDLRSHMPKAIPTVIACGLIALPLFQTGKKLLDYGVYFDNSEELTAAANYVRETVPEEDMDAFVQYQGSQGIYLLLDVVPCYHNYSFQETQAGKSPVLAEDVVKEFSTCKAKYILSRGNDGLIRDILDTKYEPLPSRKCKNATYTLYKRLED